MPQDYSLPLLDPVSMLVGDQVGRWLSTYGTIPCPVSMPGFNALGPRVNSGGDHSMLVLNEVNARSQRIIVCFGTDG